MAVAIGSFSTTRNYRAHPKSRGANLGTSSAPVSRRSLRGTPAMSQLRGSQRKWLRGRAHALEPIVRVGKNGLTEAVLAEIDAALEAHELVKIQAVAPREEKDAIEERLADGLNAEVVGRIGHVFILYREHPDPEERKIRLPG